jgi:hypothetical protein
MGIWFDGAFLRREKITRQLGSTRATSGWGGTGISDPFHINRISVRICSEIQI